MRRIVWKLLIAVGVLFGLLFLLFAFGAMISAAKGEFAGRLPQYAVLLLFTATLGAISYFSFTVGWHRLTGKEIGVPARYVRLPGVNLPRVPLLALLVAMAAALAFTAVVVAFQINRLEFNEFIAASAEAILPWDPTRTARKYVILATLVAVCSFAWFRSGRRGRSIALLPALMLTLAVPLGAVGYEMRSNYWSYSYWIEKGKEGREEKIKDPYLYLGEPQAENSIAIRVRNDMIQLLQLAERSGMGGAPDHWNELRQLEREVRQRRGTGLALVVIAVGLLGGAVLVVRRERNTSK